MAKLTSKILGNVNGAVGDLTFAKWKDQTVVKGKIASRNTPPTEKQALVREKFKTITQIAKAFSPAINMGLTGDPKLSPNNSFRKLNSRKVDGTIGAINVNYPNISISSGNNDGLMSVTSSITGKEVTSNWLPGGEGKPSDKIVMVAYNPTLQKTVMNQSLVRSAGTGKVTVPDHWTGQVYTYLFTKDESSKKASDTFFAGGVTIV